LRYTALKWWFPQVEEPNSRNQFSVEQIKLFNTATPTTINSISKDGHYEVKEVLEERTTDTSRHEYKVKWVGYTNHHNSWVAEEDLHASCLLAKQVGAQQPRTECRTQGTLLMVFRLVGEVKAVATFWEFQLEMSCAPCLINMVYLLP